MSPHYYVNCLNSVSTKSSNHENIIGCLLFLQCSRGIYCLIPSYIPHKCFLLEFNLTNNIKNIVPIRMLALFGVTVFTPPPSRIGFFITHPLWFWWEFWSYLCYTRLVKTLLWWQYRMFRIYLDLCILALTTICIQYLYHNLE